MGSLDCFISIENRMKWLQSNISITFITLMIFVISFISNIYQIFAFKISKITESDSPNKTTTFYEREKCDFYSTSLFTLIEFIQTLMRDIIIVTILLIINLFILIKIKHVRKRKKRLQVGNNQINLNATRAENRKIKMIFTLFLLYVFVYIPTFISYRFPFGISYVSIIFQSFTEFIYYLSYSTFILIYFFFNNQSIINRF
jgi:hypothetical protein